MYPRRWFAWVLLLAVVLIQANVAEAIRWRRRRYRYYGSTSQLAAQVDQKSVEHRRLDAHYDYDLAKSKDVAFNDRIRVFLNVKDESVLNAKEQIVAEVKIVNLTNSKNVQHYFVPIRIDKTSEKDYKPATFDLVNKRLLIGRLIKPASVYRLFVNLHRQSRTYGKDSLIGRVGLPYYVATSGRTKLARARQQIVMRTFRELYYAKMGWRTDEYYVMDCYAYYMWATGFCTVGAYNGRTNLGNLFNGTTPFNHGGQIAEISEKNPIHGDYVRKPGHSFMLLAYDSEQQTVWTMEGNYGATIEIAVRPVNSGWQVGHLLEQHIRGGVFDKNTKPASSENKDAS